MVAKTLVYNFWPKHSNVTGTECWGHTWVCHWSLHLIKWEMQHVIPHQTVPCKFNCIIPWEMYVGTSHKQYELHSKIITEALFTCICPKYICSYTLLNALLFKKGSGISCRKLSEIVHLSILMFIEIEPSCMCWVCRNIFGIFISQNL